MRNRKQQKQGPRDNYSALHLLRPADILSIGRIGGLDPFEHGPYKPSSYIATRARRVLFTRLAHLIFLDPQGTGIHRRIVIGLYFLVEGLFPNGPPRMYRLPSAAQLPLAHPSGAVTYIAGALTPGMVNEC